jgi:hypothetical protein
MTRKVHAIVQDASDVDKIGGSQSEQHQVAWPADRAVETACPLPAEQQVIAPKSGAKLVAIANPGSLSVGRQIIQRAFQQGSVTAAPYFAETALTVVEDRVDVAISRWR